MSRRCRGFGIVLLLQTLGLILVPDFDWGAVLAQEPVQTFTLAQGISHALSNSREFQVAQKVVTVRTLGRGAAPKEIESQITKEV